MPIIIPVEYRLKTFSQWRGWIRRHTLSWSHWAELKNPGHRLRKCSQWQGRFCNFFSASANCSAANRTFLGINRPARLILGANALPRMPNLSAINSDISAGIFCNSSGVMISRIRCFFSSLNGYGNQLIQSIKMGYAQHTNIR